MPLVAVLQVGPAFAPSVPQFNQGDSAPCVITFFDSVTQIQTDPDGSAITGQAIAPDGSVVTLTCTRADVGAYASSVPLLQAGQYGIQFAATQGAQTLTLQTTANVVLGYVSPALSAETIQWTFVSASSTPMPYQAVPGAPALAVDLRAGAVIIDLWSPEDGDVITIKDWYGLCGTTPLTIVAGAGFTVEVPNAGGTYAEQVNAVPPTGTQTVFEATYKYSLQAAAWGRVS